MPYNLFLALKKIVISCNCIYKVIVFDVVVQWKWGYSLISATWCTVLKPRFLVRVGLIRSPGLWFLEWNSAGLLKLRLGLQVTEVFLIVTRKLMLVHDFRFRVTFSWMTFFGDGVTSILYHYLPLSWTVLLRRDRILVDGLH